MKCPLCGYEFAEAKEKCASCPMHKTCKITCCPNCGYELVPESKLAKLAAKILKKQEVEKNDT